MWSWVESVNTASGHHVINDIKHDDVVDKASPFLSDLSILDENTDDDTLVDISDPSYDEGDDNEDSLTTVTYMSDFTIFLDDSEDEDTLTTVTSLSNFTADLFDEDDISRSDYSSDESIDDVIDNASTFSSDLSILDENTDDDTSVDISDLSYNEDDDDEDSLTTVIYMSDFTIFLDDSEDEDTLTTVTSLSNFTADLFEDDISLSDYSSNDSLDDLSGVEGREEEKPFSSQSHNSKAYDQGMLKYSLMDTAHAILDELMASRRSHMLCTRPGKVHKYKVFWLIHDLDG